MQAYPAIKPLEVDCGKQNIPFRKADLEEAGRGWKRSVRLSASIE
jgi:hypothetical protein